MTHDTDADRTMRPEFSDTDRSSGHTLIVSDNAGVCNRRFDEPIAMSGEVDDESTCKRERVVKWSWHNPPRDAETVDNAVGIGSQNDAGQDVDRYVTGAPPRDRATGSVTWASSLRVQTRSQMKQSTGGQGRQLRRPNAPFKLPDISLGSQWTRDEIVRLQGEDPVLREVRTGCHREMSQVTRTVQVEGRTRI
jgi:hypothetical protein